ncbi:MAG: hypothetical protein UH211_10080 [Agathobacter sp.]|nr:hypothetical protein [Agathobacter sp.]
MKFTTKNEFDHFDFTELHVNEVEYTGETFRICIDDVGILPENSKNTDIRKMRANGLILSILDANIIDFIEEGYKIYDANGNLQTTEEDVIIDASDYKKIFDYFVDCYSFEITKNDNEYTFVIDGNNERTYCIKMTGSSDMQEWDKFLNL